MAGRELHLCAAILASLLAAACLKTSAQTIPPTSYASISTDGEAYAGPGRVLANDLAGHVIRIGILAPLQGARKSEGDAMVAAAQMALKDASRDASSRRTGHRQRVVLAVKDSSGPAWGVISDAVIRLMLNDDAIAVITSTSGADTHLCEQVGNRIGVPVLTLSADATTTQIDIPWIFRMGPSDINQAQLLAHDIYSVRKLRNVLLITQKDYDGDRAVEAMRQAASGLGAPSPQNVLLDAASANLEALVRRIHNNSPQAVVIWTSDATATSLIRAAQTAGVETLYFLPQEVNPRAPYASTSDRITTEAWTIDEDDEWTIARQNFATRFKRTTGTSPSIVASETYDAVMLTVHALETAGANRARVRDALTKAHNYDGVSGNISFDREGNDRAALYLVPLQ